MQEFQIRKTRKTLITEDTKKNDPELHRDTEEKGAVK